MRDADDNVSHQDITQGYHTGELNTTSTNGGDGYKRRVVYDFAANNGSFPAPLFALLPLTKPMVSVRLTQRPRF